MSIIDQLNPSRQFIERTIRQELEAQGHVMTGALTNSIKVDVKEVAMRGGRGIEYVGSFLRYGIYVDRGVEASRVPYPSGKGGKSSYIQGLVRFVTLRRIASGKKALGIAFAIAKTHKKEGIPSKGSKRFSKNGRRKEFVTFALREREREIADKIIEDFQRVVEVEIDNRLIKGIKL